MIDKQQVFDAYVECMLWSTNADHLDPEGTGDAGALEDHYRPEDLSAEARESITRDIEAFLNDPELTEALEFWSNEIGDDHIGHDFALTRNGHGAGFWDRFSGGDLPGTRYGRILTDAAKAYGESYFYAANADTLEVSPDGS